MSLVRWRKKDTTHEDEIRDEQSLLETIEMLNAAVEERDPYTAGHSQRVRRVALAVGRALELTSDELDALGTAALFHDIGKIGMPDSILTKPDRLTRSEQALMREHVTRGETSSRDSLRFAARFPACCITTNAGTAAAIPRACRARTFQSRLRSSALSMPGETMTSNRPYAPALSLTEALAEVRAGRGLQFSPAAIDALWEVARLRPADVLPWDAPAALGAVGS